MPNHTANIIIVKGDLPMVLEFINNVKSETEKEKPLDFNKIIPCPQELVDTEKGWTKDTEVQKINDLKTQSNIKKYGYETWYEFNMDNWGTKWNAYGFVEGGWYDIPEENYENFESCKALYFETAWDCPNPILEKMAELYPLLNFIMYSCHEDGNCIKKHEINEDCNDLEDISFNDDEGYDLLEKLGRTHLVEEDEDESWELNEDDEE